MLKSQIGIFVFSLFEFQLFFEKHGIGVLVMRFDVCHQPADKFFAFHKFRSEFIYFLFYKG